MDDILVKSKESADHVTHLSKMFDILRDYMMNLNPQKCVFGWNLLGLDTIVEGGV